jgi:DHHC palmitoyltransferase
MSSQPSTPTRIRQRIGSDVPYRDDPTLSSSGRFQPPQQPSSPLWANEAEKPKTKPYYDRRSCWRRQCCRRRNDDHPSDSKDDQDHDDDYYYYQDDFNDQSWSCSVGTSDDHGIWMNRADPAGTLMSASVWLLFAYSVLTMAWLARTHGIPNMGSYLYTILACLAVACHVKTSWTDPGSVPASAVPTQDHRRRSNHTKLSMCTQCQSYKPPLSHHCRICNRCISRMDHHCPWMNNCTYSLLLFSFSHSLTHSLTHVGLLLFLLLFDSCVERYMFRFEKASEPAI